MWSHMLCTHTRRALLPVGTQLQWHRAPQLTARLLPAGGALLHCCPGGRWGDVALLSPWLFWVGQVFCRVHLYSDFCAVSALRCWLSLSSSYGCLRDAHLHSQCAA